MIQHIQINPTQKKHFELYITLDIPISQPNISYIRVAIPNKKTPKNVKASTNNRGLVFYGGCNNTLWACDSMERDFTVLCYDCKNDFKTKKTGLTNHIGRIDCTLQNKIS